MHSWFLLRCCWALGFPACLCAPFPQDPGTSSLQTSPPPPHTHFPPFLLFVTSPEAWLGCLSPPSVLGGLWACFLSMPPVKGAHRLLPKLPRTSQAVCGGDRSSFVGNSPHAQLSQPEETASPSCFQENPAASSLAKGVRDPPNRRGGGEGGGWQARGSWWRASVILSFFL